MYKRNCIPAFIPLRWISCCIFCCTCMLLSGCSRFPEKANCVEKASAHERDGEYNLAIEYLSNCILKQRNAELFLLRGKNRMYIRDYRRARLDLDTSIMLNPSFIAAHFFKGECFYNLDSFDSSVVYLSKALEMKFQQGNGIAYDVTPMFSNQPFEIQTYQIRYQRGLSYYELEEDSLALVDFRIAAADNFRLGDTYLYIGATNIHLGRIEQGCKALRLAIQQGNKEAKKYIKEFCGTYSE